MSQTKPVVTFIIPDLIDPVSSLKQLPVHELPELPVFSLFLSRGKSIIPTHFDYSSHNLYSCLFKHLKLPSDLSPLPIASYSSLFDMNTGEHNFFADDFNNKWIMRLDPGFMVADRDQLVLAKTADLGLSLLESRQFVEEINQFYSHYKEDSFWTIKALSPERWYLISDKPINIETVPPEKVIGQSVKSHILRGSVSSTKDESRYWLNLFNEFQMILHKSPVNQLRQKSHKITVNSLWFWGQSQCVSGAAAQSDLQVYSNNVIAQALSFHQGGQYADLPESYLSSSGKNTIFVIDDFFRALQNRDIFSWVGLLQQFEITYLTPVLNDIKSGKIARLEIISPTGRTLIVTKKLLAYWWRRNNHFRHFFSKNF